MSENQDAIILWTKLQTQWNVGMGGLVGLKYEAIPLLAEIYCIDLSVALMEKIRLMESLTLKNSKEKNEK